MKTTVKITLAENIDHLHDEEFVMCCIVASHMNIESKDESDYFTVTEESNRIIRKDVDTKQIKSIYKIIDAAGCAVLLGKV